MSEDDKKRFDQILFSAFPDEDEHAVVDMHVQNAAQSKVDLKVAKVRRKIETRKWLESLFSTFNPWASGNKVADKNPRTRIRNLEEKMNRFEKIALDIHLPPKEVLENSCILS